MAEDYTYLTKMPVVDIQNELIEFSNDEDASADFRTLAGAMVEVLNGEELSSTEGEKSNERTTRKMKAKEKINSMYGGGDTTDDLADEESKREQEKNETPEKEKQEQRQEQKQKQKQKQKPDTRTARSKTMENQDEKKVQGDVSTSLFQEIVGKHDAKLDEAVSGLLKGE